jgi:hypothetical protein
MHRKKRPVRYPRDLKPCKSYDGFSDSDGEDTGSRASSMESFPVNLSCSLSMLDDLCGSSKSGSECSKSCCARSSSSSSRSSKKRSQDSPRGCGDKRRFHTYYGSDHGRSSSSSSRSAEPSRCGTKDKACCEKDRLVLFDTFNRFKLVSPEKRFCLYDVCGRMMSTVRFSMFGNHYYTADDAQLENDMGFLNVSSQPFYNTTPYGAQGATEDGYLDHYKFVAFSECAFPAQPCKELYYESCAAVMTQQTEDHPFRRDKHNVEDPLDDPRLATAGVSMFDFETHVLADVLFTNKSIYAAYGRLPTCREGSRDAAAFLAMTKIGTRDACKPLCDFQNVGIGYDKDRGLLRWYINGNETYRVTQIGHRPPNAKNSLVLDHGGREETVCPKQFWIGFGTYTYLDAHKPNNAEGAETRALVRLVSLPGYYFYPLRPDADTGAPVLDDTFYDDDSLPGSRVWGQGAILRLQHIKVSYRSCQRCD